MDSLGGLELKQQARVHPGEPLILMKKRDFILSLRDTVIKAEYFRYDLISIWPSYPAREIVCVSKNYKGIIFINQATTLNK